MHHQLESQASVVWLFKPQLLFVQGLRKGPAIKGNSRMSPSCPLHQVLQHWTDAVIFKAGLLSNYELDHVSLYLKAFPSWQYVKKLVKPLLLVCDSFRLNIFGNSPRTQETPFAKDTCKPSWISQDSRDAYANETPW